MRGVTPGGSDLTEGGRLTAVPVVEGVDGVAKRGVCGVRAVLVEARVGLSVLP